MVDFAMQVKRETRRDQIVAFVAEYAVDHKGNSPSLGELAAHFQVSRQAIYVHTLKLANEDRVRWRDGKLCLIGAEFSPPLTM